MHIFTQLTLVLELGVQSVLQFGVEFYLCFIKARCRLPNQDECKTDNSNIFVVVTIILVVEMLKESLFFKLDLVVNTDLLLSALKRVFPNLIKETMNAVTKLLHFRGFDFYIIVDFHIFVPISACAGACDL